MSFCKVAVIKFNPFRTDASASKVKSSLTSISLENKAGSAIPVNDVSDPIMLYVVNTPKEEADKEVDNEEGEDKNSIVSMSVNSDKSQVAYHTEKIRNESFRALFDIQQPGRKLTVRLKKNKKPTDTIYDYEFNLPDNSSCKWKNVTENGNSSIDIFMDWPDKVVCKQHPWSVFISDKENLDGTYIMGR